MLPHCPVLFQVLSRRLSLPSMHPSTDNSDQEKCDWSGVKAVFLSFLTQLHGLFLSAFPSLFSSPQAHLFGMPFLNACGAGWMSPGGEAVILPSSSRCCPSVMQLGSASRTAGTLSCTKQPEILSTESVILCLRVNARRVKGREYLSPLCTS